MKYSNEQFLSLMKDYFIYKYKELVKTNGTETSMLIAEKNRKVNYPYMVELFELSGFPKVVSDAKFQEIDSMEFYRGVKDPEHTANMLCDFNYHYGEGFIADGLYMTPDFEEAETYTRDDDKKRHIDNILELKLSPDTKICSILDIINLESALEGLYYDDEPLEDTINEGLYIFKKEKNYSEIEEKIKDLFNFFNKIEDEKDKEIFFTSLIKGFSKLAIYLGFDAMCITTEEVERYYTVFNREKIIVPQSEFNRFVANSKGYNANGTIKRLSGDSEGEESDEKIPQKC